MKKILSLLLVLTMALGLLACGGAEKTGGTVTTAASEGSFRVGYGKANITPDGPVGMGGYGNNDKRISTGILNYLYVTCVAITDGGDNTILLYGMDLASAAYTLQFRADVSEATGVPVDNIVFSASHTHSAPDYGVNTGHEKAALEKLGEGFVKAARIAMEDRKEARMYGGSIDTEGMNFVRHYICNDGSYCGDNFGNDSSGYAGHATQADPQLQLIKFVREGDNDIYITNFQTHPHQTGGSTKTNLAADIVGEYRECMEKELGCEVVYFSGAGGNINSRSRIAEENATADWKEWGQKLAWYAQQVEFTELKTGKVQVSLADFEAEINHEYDSVAVICGDLYERWQRGEITKAELIEVGSAHGIKLNSQFHASAIKSRAGMDRSKTFSIGVYSFGDVGFIAFPGEQFDTNGKFIKENSPFAMTLIATLANGGGGYFPSEQAFEYGCYEVDSANYVCGTAEHLADQYVEMLQAQFNSK